jgi:hypothetical protein
MKSPFGARLITAVVLAACAWPVTAQTMRAHFLDVGQGSAAIIENRVCRGPDRYRRRAQQ